MESILPNHGWNRISIYNHHGELWYLMIDIPGNNWISGNLQINRGYPLIGKTIVHNEFDQIVYEEEFGMPKRVCVRSYHLNLRNIDIKRWIDNPENILCTAGCRIPTTIDNYRTSYVHPPSKWTLKCSIKQHGIIKAVELYEDQLRYTLQNYPNELLDFKKLYNAKELGCFCPPGYPCHIDVIIKLLKEFV